MFRPPPHPPTIFESQRGFPRNASPRAAVRPGLHRNRRSRDRRHDAGGVTGAGPLQHSLRPRVEVAQLEDSVFARRRGGRCWRRGGRFRRLSGGGRFRRLSGGRGFWRPGSRLWRRGSRGYGYRPWRRGNRLWRLGGRVLHHGPQSHRQGIRARAVPAAGRGGPSRCAGARARPGAPAGGHPTRPLLHVRHQHLHHARLLGDLAGLDGELGVLLSDHIHQPLIPRPPRVVVWRKCSRRNAWRKCSRRPLPWAPPPQGRHPPGVQQLLTELLDPGQPIGVFRGRRPRARPRV
jgi:hypothetical protein